MLDDSAGAVRYWAHVKWAPLNGEPNKQMVVQEADEDGSVDDGTPELFVTVEDIARGWQLLLAWEKAGKFHHCGSSDAVQRAERSLTNRDGGHDYDACVADAVVQLATLGEIRYG
ncbi:hypothetical protein [Nocardia sp. NPDC050435]|uniref:hypothetical protein n=1 Tax=Nocardia sp. NPDC050435 TaxID=3155040 RepID=UPI0033D113E5